MMTYPRPATTRSLVLALTVIPTSSACFNTADRLYIGAELDVATGAIAFFTGLSA